MTSRPMPHSYAVYPLPNTVRCAANSVKYRVKRTLASHGWHIGRSEIDWTLDAYLPHLFRAFDINCVIDVGARVGDYGTLLRKTGYTGHIISFEPVAESFGELRRRCAADPQWTAYPYALGSRDEVGTINVMHYTVFSSMLRPSGLQEYGNEVKYQETIQVRRLDHLFAAITRHIEHPRAYLKMDTQGWDLEVFLGAEGCLEQVAALQSELSVRPIYERIPGYEQALAVYRDAGYVESAFFRVTCDPHWRLVEFDRVMVRDTTAQSSSGEHNYPYSVGETIGRLR